MRLDLFLLVVPLAAQVNVTTYQYSNARTGANLNESILTPANVNASQFGKLFTYPLAYDPHRAVYAKFADSGIPRVYVVDRKGRIVYQTIGFDPDQGVSGLEAAVQKALAAK